MANDTDKPESEWLSIYDAKPSKSGWYPVLICYEPREGFFPNPSYWDGVSFSDAHVSNFLDTVFENSDDAEKFAYDNDPYW